MPRWRPTSCCAPAEIPGAACVQPNRTMREIPSTSKGESETLLTGPVDPPPAGSAETAPPPPPPGRVQRPLLAALDRFPVVHLLVYYVLLVAAGAVLTSFFPLVRDALVEPNALTPVSGSGGLLPGVPATGVAAPPGPASETLERALTTLVVILGALALVLPVAWVYMRIKRFRYDPALVRSIIILPIVVAGIAVVVKDSLALAFSLAGIVAAVRFRNTLKDPRDAVYIFLVIGIGLSAGVQVLDVALVMSLIFNLVVLSLWKYNVGSVYSGRFARTGVLSIGDPSLLVAQTPEEQRLVRGRLLEDARKLKADGILLVHTAEPELARHTVQEALGDVSRDWKLVGITDGARDVSTLEYLLRLKKEVSPLEVVGALDERWSSQVEGAEFVPFRERKRKRKKKERSIQTEESGRE